MRRAQAVFRQNGQRNEERSTTPSATELDDLADEVSSVRPNCLSIKNARYTFRLFAALPVQSLGKHFLQSTAYRRSGPRTIKACHLEAGESRIYLYIVKDEAEKIQEP